MRSPESITWLRGYHDVRDAFAQGGLLQSSYDGAKDTIFANVLITLDGPGHLNRRRAEMALVRPQFVEFFERSLIPAAAALLIARTSPTGEADLVELSRLISTSMAARIVGLDDCETVERLEDLSALMAKLHEGVVIEWSLRPREQVLAEVALARDEYRKSFFGPSYRRRAVSDTAGSHAEGVRHLDLISLLLRNLEKETLDEENMLRETIHYLVASAHTTATVIVHAANDLWTWLADHPDDADKASDPHFLLRCAQESLRLWPPSAFQYRHAAADTALKSGRVIARGETVGLHLIDANRDPEVFGSRAGVFDPFRELPPGIAGYGLAFGAGPHVCPGRRLASGGDAVSGEVGVLVAVIQALLAAGCQPHPARAPEIQDGTVRHQYRSYPVVFAAPSPGDRRALHPSTPSDGGASRHRASGGTTNGHA